MLHFRPLTLLLLAALAPSAAASAATSIAGDSSTYAAKTPACACEACTMSKADVDVLFASMLAGKLPTTFCEGTDEAYIAKLTAHPIAFYRNALAWRPSDVDALVERVRTSFDARTTSDAQKSAMIDLLASFPSSANKIATASVWKNASALFTTDHLLALADSGPMEIQKKLRERAQSDVGPAVHFALRGDDVGKSTLERAVRKFDIAKSDTIEPAVAAVGLARLGDKKALAEVTAGLRDGALTALDQNDLARARTLALQAEFTSKLAAQGASADLRGLDHQFGGYCKDKNGELASADAIFQRIAAL